VKSTLKRSAAVAAALSVASALCPSIAGADEAAAVHTLGGQAELINGNVVRQQPRSQRPRRANQ
jgi:hypothetical protein